MPLTRRAFAHLIGAGAAAAAMPRLAYSAPRTGAGNGVVRLSANENPYGPSSAAIAAMRSFITTSLLIQRGGTARQRATSPPAA